MRILRSFRADITDELTIDHFQPRACAGTDDFPNLIYCCVRCNLYKADYWASQAAEPLLWNPRTEPRERHMLPLANGTLWPLTPTGAFTIKRLRLNRPLLVAWRLRKQTQGQEERLLSIYREQTNLLERLSQQQAALLKEHRALLNEQRELMRALLGLTKRPEI